MAIQAIIIENPEDWYVQKRRHFEGGMAIRNRLRDLGFLDETYGNLDDHYVAIVEIAVLWILDES